MKIRLFLILAGSITWMGCVSAPHEVVSLHEKERALHQEVRRTHLALVDAYVDQRLALFENFYFSQYGPRFRKNWESNFKQKTGRDYDPERDFNSFHQDLVAEYIDQIKPIEAMRIELKNSVTTAYDQLERSHAVVGDWIQSVEKLNRTQREFANNLLKAASPSISLDKIDDQIKKVTDNLNGKN